MNNIGPTFIAVIAGIISLAIVAVLVAQKAMTSSVIQSAGGALAGVISAAVAPVSSGGNTTSGNNSTGSLNGASGG